MDCIYIALYNLCLSFTHSHTPTAIGSHARYQPAHQEQFGSVSCSGTLRHAQSGIEPATLRLPDNSSYLLSHIAPLWLKCYCNIKTEDEVSQCWWLVMKCFSWHPWLIRICVFLPLLVFFNSFVFCILCPIWLSVVSPVLQTHSLIRLLSLLHVFLLSHLLSRHCIQLRFA